MTNLFAKLWNRPSLAVNDAVSLIAGGALLKPSPGLSAFWHPTLSSFGTRFLSMSSTHRCHAFSVLTMHLSHTHCGRNFGGWRCDSIHFFFLHSFAGRRFILTVDLSNLGIRFFYYYYFLRWGTFILSLKGSALGLLCGTFELPASLLSPLGARMQEGRGTGPRHRDTLTTKMAAACLPAARTRSVGTRRGDGARPGR